jgi:hypothetical protein
MTDKITLKEFKRRFQKLRESGFVKSLRKGPTGIGYTLETQLQLKENNLVMPDVGFAELKAHRVGSGSLVTLFTFNRKVWKVDCLEAIRKYGSADKNGRLGLYYTMGPIPNSAGLFVKFERHSVDLRHIDGTMVASWPLAELATQFAQKIPALLFVTAEVELRDGIEYFHFARCQFLTGVSETSLAQQFAAGHILLDLRLHDKGTAARNHGTGFRAFEKNFPQLFTKSEDL